VELLVVGASLFATEQYFVNLGLKDLLFYIVSDLYNVN